MAESVRRRWSWWRESEDDGVEADELPADAEVMLPPPVLMESSALFTRYQASEKPSFMFISLFGLTGSTIAERADLVDQELGQQGLIPVYLVDQAEFSSLRAEQRLFEYLPSAWEGVRRAPDLDWPFYLRRRYLLLQAKWQPIGRIDFGDIPEWLPDHEDIAQA